MKINLKNTSMIILIIVLLGTMFLTMNYIKDNSANNNLQPTPNAMNDNSNEPPAKPDDNMKQEQPNNSTDSKSSNTPPEMPNNNDSNNDSNEPPEMPGNMTTTNMPSNSSTIETKYYVVLGIEGLLVSILIVYLIMSGFNKKSFKETFSSNDKILIYVLSLIILTAVVTYGSGEITKNYFLDNSNNNNQMSPDGMNQNNSSVSYKATKEITTDDDIADTEYESSTADENAVLVTGDVKVNISNSTITKTGDSNGGDSTSFYGNNSAVLAKDKATLTLDNLTITTNADGANGVFSYGGSATTNNSESDGTTVNISNSKITTTGDNAGGIMTTGGGIMNANNLTINTSGTSSAAIRTDRGGGEVTVDGGTYTTKGQGSPTIYSTANVSVKNAILAATASEEIVIEGKNSVTIDNCDLTDTNNKLNGNSTTYKNIFLYQSMSGDAATGNATFTATNSNIITNKGDTLYVTNTTATINLTNNKITNNDTTGNFLRIQKDSWGNTGSNGGDVTLNLTNQKVTGNIVVDSISKLTMTLKTSSSYEGAINSDNSAKEINLTLDKSSTIKLTKDSYVTSLENEDTENSNIDFNGYKLYVNGKAIN